MNRVLLVGRLTAKPELRYTNSNIKIISLGNKTNEETISSWIKENKIDVKFFKDITENELKEFYNSDKPEIIFIGGI